MSAHAREIAALLGDLRAARADAARLNELRLAAEAKLDVLREELGAEFDAALRRHELRAKRLAHDHNWLRSWRGGPLMCECGAAR